MQTKGDEQAEGFHDRAYLCDRRSQSRGSLPSSLARYNQGRWGPLASRPEADRPERMAMSWLSSCSILGSPARQGSIPTAMTPRSGGTDTPRLSKHVSLLTPSLFVPSPTGERCAWGHLQSDAPLQMAEPNGETPTDIDLGARLQPEETTPLAASWRFHRENAVRAAKHPARPLATPDLSAVSLP
jgi:hypothetical protein